MKKALKVTGIALLAIVIAAAILFGVNACNQSMTRANMLRCQEIGERAGAVTKYVNIGATEKCYVQVGEDRWVEVTIYQ